LKRLSPFGKGGNKGDLTKRRDTNADYIQPQPGVNENDRSPQCPFFFWWQEGLDVVYRKEWSGGVSSFAKASEDRTECWSDGGKEEYRIQEKDRAQGG